MIGCKRSARFGFQGLEDSYAIYSGCLGNFPNSTGADYICNRGLEYDFVTFKERFVDVCGSIRRIAKILVEFLLHVPRRCRLNFFTHCSVPENLSVVLSHVLSFVSDRSYLIRRAKAQLLRLSLRNKLVARYGLRVAFHTSRLSAKYSHPGGHALRRHVIVF